MMSKNKICVDIGSSAIKILIGRRKGTRFMIEDALMKEYDPGMDLEKNITTALRSALWELDIRRALLYTCLSSGDVIFRYAMFPNVSRRQLNQVLSNELQRYMPVSLDEIIVQPLIFERTSVLKEPILLVGASKVALYSLEKIIKTAGYRTRFIGVDSIVLANFMNMLYPLEDEPLCFVDIGKRYMKIFILRAGKIHFIRTVHLGGQDIDVLIRDRLDVSLDVAETIKKGENAIADVLALANRVLAFFVDEIYVSIDYYESQFGDVPSKIVLTGGTAKLKGFADFLADRLNSEVVVFSLPESRIFCYDGEVRELILKHLPEFSVALGMVGM